MCALPVPALFRGIEVHPHDQSVQQRAILRGQPHVQEFLGGHFLFGLRLFSGGEGDAEKR